MRKETTYTYCIITKSCFFFFGRFGAASQQPWWIRAQWENPWERVMEGLRGFN